jgi:uncharacterized membrane protein
MSKVEKSAVVDRDVTTVYNQWTQFEEFPRFMQGVEQVEQTDDRHLHWRADIGMAEREWDAEITEQQPDRLIAWRSIGDVRNDGRVMFEPVGLDETRVTVVIEYDAEGLVEKAGDALGVVDRRVEGDLGRFKEFIENRDLETGGYRGEIR